MDASSEIIDKLRQAIPALNFPASTFEVVTDDCDERFVKIIAYDQLGGNVTGTLNCDEVNIVIDFAEIIGGAQA